MWRWPRPIKSGPSRATKSWQERKLGVGLQCNPNSGVKQKVQELEVALGYNIINQLINWKLIHL